MARVASRNGYGYVEGNPVNYTDPSGECWASDTAYDWQQRICADAFYQRYANKNADSRGYPDDANSEYWGSLSYEEFKAGWNQTDHTASSQIAAAGSTIALKTKNPFTIIGGLLVVGGVTLCVAALEALARYDPYDFPAAEAASLTFPLVLQSRHFDWKMHERDALDMLRRALPLSDIKFMYRGTSLNRAYGQSYGGWELYQGRLWLFDKVQHAASYSVSAGQLDRDMSVIVIYAISNAILNALIASGNVTRRLGIEYAFDETARQALVGPIIIPFPDNFGG